MKKKLSKKKLKLKVMAFGTFDGLHKGHLDFFRQAKNCAKDSFLIVSVARDKNVLKIKGHYPSLNERKRLALVKKLIKKSRLVNKVVLAGAQDHIPHIIKERPNIIALGYDQKTYVKNLKKDLKNKGIIVKIARLKPYKEKIYKSRLLKIKR